MGFKKINSILWLCTSYCPATPDGDVMYWDASDISVTTAVARAPALAEELVATGLFRWSYGKMVLWLS